MLIVSFVVECDVVVFDMDICFGIFVFFVEDKFGDEVIKKFLEFVSFVSIVDDLVVVGGINVGLGI